MAGPAPAALLPGLATECVAPPSWRLIEFISDTHLQAEDPATAQAWLRHLGSTQADALFLLGDVFEVWVGDDLLGHDPFIDGCALALHRLSQRCALFFLHGNRDFLAGPGLMQACGAQMLADPCVLVLGTQRVMLSHGDALCLDDGDYLAFRAQVRSSAWQEDFLARPLAERMDVARALRAQSKAQHGERLAQGRGYSEVDNTAARQALTQARSKLLIHGHTHRPQGHDLGTGLRREVLSDWDLGATPPPGPRCCSSMPTTQATGT